MSMQCMVASMLTSLSLRSHCHRPQGLYKGGIPGVESLIVSPESYHELLQC